MWEIQSDSSGPVAVRKHEDSAKLQAGAHATQSGHEVLDEQSDNFDVGQFVMLFMGGRKIAARVLDNQEGMLKLSTTEGELDSIPSSWVRKADPGMPPASTRAITREDIPAQSAPMHQSDPRVRKNAPPVQLGDTAKTIEQMVQAGGGKALISIPSAESGQQRMLEVTVGPDGSITANVHAMAPKLVDGGRYGNFQQLVDDLKLEGASRTLQVLSPGQGWSRPKY